MKTKDILAVGTTAVILTFLIFGLFHHVRIFPPAASHEAAFVDESFQAMLNVTVPIFALVLSFLLYTLFRFISPEGEGAKFDGHRGVETVWIAVSLILTLGLAAYGSQELIKIRGDDHADLDVQVKAVQFSWEFYYPESNVYTHELILPKDRRVRLLLSSGDVVHSFWVPEFRLKQDVVPGKVTKLLFTPTKIGSYRLLCSQLCGVDHTVMTAPVRVVEAEEFQDQVKGENWE